MFIFQKLPSYICLSFHLMYKHLDTTDLRIVEKSFFLDKGIVNMKVRLLFLATLVSSKQDDLDEKDLEKVKKDEPEDFDQTAVVTQALENVRKIFKDINTENGRENAIK